MVCELVKHDEINVLISEANWAWPVAVRNIFAPRGVNMLLVKRPEDLLEIVHCHRIHTAIFDLDCENLSGLGAVRIVRAHNPLMPCILLADRFEWKILNKALELEVFSVISKPVDLDVLLLQLDRLFVRHYKSKLFSTEQKR